MTDQISINDQVIQNKIYIIRMESLDIRYAEMLNNFRLSISFQLRERTVLPDTVFIVSNFCGY